MPLIEQTMTEKNLQAHQRNARQSHGTATPEGKERARAANLQHGYYSEMRDQALVALGEDPAALAALAEGARQQFRPANAYQEWITDRIASLQWRIQRAERQQESKAASHIWTRERKRREAARQLRERCAVVQDFLESVRRAVARPDFYAPNGYFEICGIVMKKNPSANMDEIQDLLHLLRYPAGFGQPLPPPLPGALSDQEWQEEIEADQTDESAVPYPQIPVAEGCDRDALREDLWNLAATELRRVAEAWGKEIAAQEAPLSPRARDLCVMEIGKDLELLRREERSCSRELARLTKELTTMHKELAQAQKEGTRNQRAGSAAEAGAGASPASGGFDGLSMTSPGRPAVCSVDLGSTPRRSETAATTPGTATEDRAGEGIAENAGASSYAEENTCEQPRTASTKRPLEPTHPQPEADPSDDSLTELRPGASALATTSLLPANGRGGATTSPRADAA